MLEAHFLPLTTALVLALFKTSDARGRQTAGVEVGVLSPHLVWRLMEKKPNDGGDYVVITVRLPVWLLARLGPVATRAGRRLRAVAPLAYAGREGSQPFRFGLPNWPNNPEVAQKGSFFAG